MTVHTPGSGCAMPAVTFPATGRHRRFARYGTNIILLSDRGTTCVKLCEQLAQRYYLKVERPGTEPATFESRVQRPGHYIHYRLVTLLNL